MIYDTYGNVVPIEETYNTHRYSMVVTSIYCVLVGDTITVDEYVENIIYLVAIEQHNFHQVWVHTQKHRF